MKNERYFVMVASAAFSLGCQLGLTFQPNRVLGLVERIMIGICGLFVSAAIVYGFSWKLQRARLQAKYDREYLTWLRRFNAALREVAGPAAVAQAHDVTRQREQQVN